MKEKILNFVKKRNSTEIARYLPIEGESWFDTYFLEIKNAFRRAWNWKFMWFWAFFIGGIGSIDFSKLGRINDYVPENENNTDSFAVFFLDNIIWFIAGAIIGLLIFFIFWILSCVSRWGLIKSISEIQDEGKPRKDKIKEIWKKGENGMSRMFLFGVIVFSFWIFVVIAFVGAPLFVVYLFHDSLFKIFVVGVIIIIPLIIVLVLFFVIFNYIISIATIIMVLEDSRPIKSIKKAWHIMKNGYKEVIKMFIMRILFKLISTGVSIVFIVTLGVIGIFVALPGLLFVAIYNDILKNIIFDILVSFSGGILEICFIACLIVLGIVFKLTELDLWIWWVKRNVPSLRLTHNNK